MSEQGESAPGEPKRKIEGELLKVKTELKQWEAGFKIETGRCPSSADVKKRPLVLARYTRYRSLKKQLVHHSKENVSLAPQVHSRAKPPPLFDEDSFSNFYDVELTEVSKGTSSFSSEDPQSCDKRNEGTDSPVLVEQGEQLEPSEGTFTWGWDKLPDEQFPEPGVKRVRGTGGVRKNYKKLKLKNKSRTAKTRRGKSRAVRKSSKASLPIGDEPAASVFSSIESYQESNCSHGNTASPLSSTVHSQKSNRAAEVTGECINQWSSIDLLQILKTQFG